LLPDTMHANASAASAASFKSPYHSLTPEWANIKRKVAIWPDYIHQMSSTIEDPAPMYGNEL